MSTLTIKETDISTGNGLGTVRNVILFNDANHSIDQVIAQIQKAISCGIDKAMQITMEAHSKGRAIVYSGHLERCELAVSILEEIGLRTNIE